MSDMTSKILRNTKVECCDVAMHRDMIASTLELGEYGPPSYEYSSVEDRDGDLILVEVRQYMPGATLLEVSPFLSDRDADSISEQIREMVSVHGSVVSPTYASLCNPDDAIERCVDYMRSIRAFHVCSGVKECRIRKSGTPRSGVAPVLCHNSLTPDHIIVHSGRIVSVIGWSRCDFGVMQLQAVSYAYMMDRSPDENPWLGQIVCQLLNVYSGKRDRMTRFCANMYMCRLQKDARAPWIESILEDAS